tara:strand:+ start:3583 stop:3975 length:393 start_codon:yes stop_codon:yes gene_type:complete
MLNNDIPIRNQFKKVIREITNSTEYIKLVLRFGYHVEDRIRERLCTPREYVKILNFFRYAVSRNYMEFRLAQSRGYEEIIIELNDYYRFVIIPSYGKTNDYSIRTFYVCRTKPTYNKKNTKYFKFYDKSV